MESKSGQKDVLLDSLAQHHNVAQFISFDPSLEQRFSRLWSHQPNYRFESLEQAIGAILKTSPEGSVNVRSFHPENPKSREFIYGCRGVETVERNVRRLAAEGLYTIINETIDISDGGVSGVAFGDLIEFSPDDTPRCVERSGTASLPREMGLKVLKTVYGFEPDFPDNPDWRVEFSIHPLPRGHRRQHTIVWEIDEPGSPPETAAVFWPNRFSRLVGDKAFGLLVGDAIGLRVPETLVIARRLAPFTFGQATGSAERWIRTCPREQMPGLFTTRRGWIDPFQLLNEEDPGEDKISSILSQHGVDAAYSGALLTQESGPLVEGVSGQGDDFMIGRRGPEDLPDQVTRDIQSEYQKASQLLGPVRFEWVHDGKGVWVVQLHCQAESGAERTIIPASNKDTRFHNFPVDRGIEALRELIAELQDSGDGIVLVGRVGLTSHFGDLLRKAHIPSRIEYPEDASEKAGQT